jgi:uncharacterized protein (TIRG00374 family)
VKIDWRVLLGFGITCFLLWWVFRHVDLAEVWTEVERANLWLLGLAVAIGYGNYVFRSMRWGILLRPIASNTSLHSRFKAMNIGFMATNLIPLRVGEFVRPYALSRLEPVSVSGAFGSLVVERFLDSLAIATLLFVAIAAPGFPDNPVVWGASLGVWIRWFLFFLGGLLVFMMVLLAIPGPVVAAVERLARFLPQNVGAFLVEVLEAFLEGLKVLQAPGLLIKAILGSLGIWLAQALSFWVAFLAFGIHVGYDGALFVNGTVALAVAAPAAPGFLGTFQLGVTGGLGVYGVPAAAAAALSLVFWLGGFFPVTMVGLFYAWRLGLSLAEVSRREPRLENGVEPAHHSWGSAGEGGVEAPGEEVEDPHA